MMCTAVSHFRSYCRINKREYQREPTIRYFLTRVSKRIDSFIVNSNLSFKH